MHTASAVCIEFCFREKQKLWRLGFFIIKALRGVRQNNFLTLYSNMFMYHFQLN